MKPLYSNDKTKQIDQLAATALGIDSFQLMQRAGTAIFAHVQFYRSLLVITGPGNNGGDGFIVAELARKNSQQVKLLTLKPTSELNGDAAKAATLYQGTILNEFPSESFDCIVDGIFGTGLNQPVRGIYQEAINWINAQNSDVVAIDIPSGLNGSTGKIEGCAVKADQTISILGHNTGLYTFDGKQCCGTISFEDLDVPITKLKVVEQDGYLLSADSLSLIKSSRRDNSHKGSFGHVLVAGGQAGMLGAVLLAGRAVLKSGAGLTTLLTDSKHADLIPLHAPELMTLGFDGMDDHVLLDKKADAIALGMGLGQSQWSEQLFRYCVKSGKPLVIDADGLSLLADLTVVPDSLEVITPHPKEAARLLSMSVEAVQDNRWQTVKHLAQKYRCVTVLKGSGTLISNGHETWCCPYGNANLATAGSGDVLSGMIAGLLAQGFAAKQASCLAVLWHALAGEQSPQGLTLTASELINSLSLIIK
ncbi:MAG: NAD(P)H-hydrate dehydratase [Marinicella sp.]|nr:NAD(P)H-hydrate dehydratase [Xanthomonadales bacterium]